MDDECNLKKKQPINGCLTMNSTKYNLFTKNENILGNHWKNKEETKYLLLDNDRNK